MKDAEDSSVNVYLDGLGLGSIAAAMYLVRKADFDPSRIHIFEQMGARTLVGGSCDASEMTVNGYQVQAMFDKDLALSDAITLERWQRRPWSLRLKKRLARAWEYWL